MRIGLIIYGSLDTLSGGYLYDRRLVEYLRAQGDEVEVISQHWGSYPARLARNFEPGLFNRLAGLRLDILLEDELNHPSLLLANRRLRGRAGYPILSVVHHLLSDERHSGVRLLAYRTVERAYLRTVDGFLYNSRTTKRSVEELLGRTTRGLVAYPGGDQFGQLEVGFAKPAHSHEGDIRILFVGNLIPRKGLHTLLQALARLGSAGWRLDVAGQEQVDPGYTRRVRRLAEPLGQRVCFHGRLDAKALERLWRENDLLVVPSTYEGFGIVYLEGMAFGLPAVATTSGAAAEIITDGENGYLVPPEQPEALARVLRGLIADRARLTALSEAARRRFQTFPTWQQSASAVREFLLNWNTPANRR